jgi:hypothetical protein
MTHKQYGYFFVLWVVLAICWAVFAKYAVVCGLLCWLAISCLWVATAFFLHCPEMLMGKRQSGSVNLLYCLVNLPFLVIYWMTWLIRHFVLRHTPVNEIAGTNVSVSCWPGFHVPLDRYDLVIDATSEMPKWYRHGNAKYLCLPNLDGVPLDRYELLFEINRDMHILVHCAQGRGRSALVACLILMKLGYVETADEAIQLLKRSRPGITLTRYQLTHLNVLFQDDL